MEKLIEKANILLEALPYIRAFYNKTIIIKFGGNAMVNEELKKGFALDIILMKYVGMNPVIVHGGGPQIGEVIEKMGLKSNFVDGMRVTNKETMDIVEMVLVGKINKEIVSLINQNGGKAVGLSGKDAELIKAKKLNIVKSFAESKPPEIIDLGMVGEVESIDPTIIEVLDKKKLIPVIAPVGVGGKGETYNINADLVAGGIASALEAEKLILLTDTKGVLDKDGSLIPTLNIEQSNQLIKEKVITGGMIPKIQCCLNALNKGVKKTHIIDGRIAHAVLLEIFTDEGIGSQIVK